MQVWVMRFICLKFVFSPSKASSETNQKDVKSEEGRGGKYKSLFLSYYVLTHLVADGPICFHNLIWFAFDSVSLGPAPPPHLSYEYPNLPITKNRQEV